MEVELFDSTGKINSILGTLRTDLLPLDFIHLGRKIPLRGAEFILCRKERGVEN